MCSNPGNDDPPPKQPAGSVENALTALEMFKTTRSLRVADVHRRLDVAPSTAHRMLRILVAKGFVAQGELAGPYTVGPALIELAASVLRGYDLPRVARPVMRVLADDLGETIHLSVLRGSEIFFLESAETDRPLRVSSRAGTTLPWQNTASGRVLIAGARQSLLESVDTERHLLPLPHDGPSAEELAAIVQEVKTQGFATSFEESEDNVASIAVPILNSNDEPMASLALSAPPARLGEKDLDQVVERLKHGAEQIRNSLPE